MARVETVSVSSTTAYQVTGPDGALVTVQNLGPDSCFYATASTVSSGLNDGTLTSGSTLTFVPSKFFISSGTSRLQVTTGTVPAFRLVAERSGQLNALSGGTRILLNPALAPVAVGANAAQGLFYLDPADYTGRFRIRLAVAVNAVAPVSDFTAGLYSISAVAGAATVVSVTLGNGSAALTNTAAAVTAPGANSLTVAVSNTFDPPIAGYYLIGMVNSAAMTASSAAACVVTLETR